MSDNIDSPELFGPTYFSPLTSADSDSDTQNVALADTTVAAEIQRLASQVARDVESCSELKRRRLKYAHLESTFELSIVKARQRINSLVEQQHRADFPDDQFNQLPAQPSDEPPQPAQPFDEPQQQRAQPFDEPHQPAQPSDEPQQQPAQPSDEQRQRPTQPSGEQPPAQLSDEQQQQQQRAQPSGEPHQPAQPSDEPQQQPA
ncbi:hypothetical protein LPJ73_004792 [Coemansia sp. RSA 2703]|nr:hypothetical protein LPJ73_004792 [Coemansia sp. RSA 2703]KAJ2377715.1 hypothetical protein IW150_001225 [Coemansia sp. RSA 2607]KAJ2393112.1 hypothetical protein GGI05_002508 [Coemansia sp. RSA 2603]